TVTVISKTLHTRKHPAIFSFGILLSNFSRRWISRPIPRIGCGIHRGSPTTRSKLTPIMNALIIPLLAEEGWMRDQQEDAKPPCFAQTGAKRERESAKH